MSSPRLRIAGVVPAGAECHAAAPSQAATTISSLLTAYSSLAKDFAAGEKATGIRKKNARHHPRPFRPFKATFHQPTLTPPLAGLENQGDSSRPRAWRATTTTPDPASAGLENQVDSSRPRACRATTTTPARSEGGGFLTPAREAIGPTTAN